MTRFVLCFVVAGLIVAGEGRQRHTDANDCSVPTFVGGDGRVDVGSADRPPAAIVDHSLLLVII